MSKPDSTPNRRQFLKFAVIGAATLPLAAKLMTHKALAADLPPIDVNGATAKALGYVEDTTKVDATKYPQHKPTQECANCKFYTAGTTRGACTLFPGQSVAAKGWCAGYLVKA